MDQQSEAYYSQAAQELARLRQMDAPAALAAMKQMDPAVFEFMTALLFEERGYPATSSGKPGDEGVDVLLQDGDYVGVVQCKRYDGSVGQPTIRDLYGTMMHNGAEEAYLVTTGTVTRQARDWSFGKPIQLIDGHVLAAWVTQTEPAAGGFSASGLFSGIFRSGWVRWPALIAALLLFGWGIFFAVTQLSSRFSGESPVAQSVEFSENAGAESASTEAEDPVADTPEVDTPAADTQTANTQITNTPTPATLVPAANTENTASAAPAATNTAVPPTAVPPTAVPPTAVPPTAVPPTTVPPTAIPPTAVPPTDVPPTDVPPTVEKTCAASPDSSLSAWYDADRLGCAHSEMQVVWAAWESFERGTMLWRSDTELAYAFVGDPYFQWFPINDSWDGESTPQTERGDPPSEPEGLQAPKRGFGYVWGKNDALFNALGWATDSEKGICLAVQEFENGTILQSNKAQSCTADSLPNQARDGSWQSFTTVAYANGSWE